MPFSYPDKQFVGREDELRYLMGLSTAGGISGNVMLTGVGGIGKTSLLQRIHRDLFTNPDGPVPFYYRFQSPSIKGATFAKDFFARLVRQTVACHMHDATFAANLMLPLQRLLYKTADKKLEFLHGLAEDFEAQSREGDFQSMIYAALSAPAFVSEKLGRRFVVMLDDFHLSGGLYENRPGDIPFASDILAGSMDAAACSFVKACTTEGGVHAGDECRMHLRGLAEDAALALFKEECSKYGVTVSDEAGELMKYTCGNPRYIRSIARAVHSMKRTSASSENFRECYAHDVAEGDTAAYIASLIDSSTGGRLMIRPALELMMRLVETQGLTSDPQRLARALSMPDETMEKLLNGLVKAGIVKAGAALTVSDDTVMHDAVRARYMSDVEGRSAGIVREDIIMRRFGPEGGAAVRFEVVIPSDVPEAELVAAKAVRQMAENAKMAPDEADRLQLAVIEACINAMEHSGSHEKKVFLTCTVKDGRIEVCVESQGGRSFELEGPAEKAEDPEDGGTPRMRGYGLKLIGGYTDGLKVERTGSRARLVLLKNIK